MNGRIKNTPYVMPRFNRAYRGLYGNRMIQFGNKISFAENKSRRTWKPNVQKTTMFSNILQRKLCFRMTTYAMRCIRKAGGIDDYLLNTKDSTIKYHKAIAVKQELIAIRKAEQAALKFPDSEKVKGRRETAEQGPPAHKAVREISGPLGITGAVKCISRGLLDAM